MYNILQDTLYKFSNKIWDVYLLEDSDYTSCTEIGNHCLQNTWADKSFFNWEHRSRQFIFQVDKESNKRNNRIWKTEHPQDWKKS